MAVPLERYVRGVVAAEMPSSWPPAALEAQAIASRTYALTDDAGGTRFDVYADTRSQVYESPRTATAETATTNAAVAATAGQIVLYDGKPAITYYFANSGGMTEDNENSFLGSTPEPWLRAVPDAYETKSSSWKLSVGFATAAARLRGLVRGSFRGIEVLQRGRLAANRRRGGARLARQQPGERAGTGSAPRADEHVGVLQRQERRERQARARRQRPAGVRRTRAGKPDRRSGAVAEHEPAGRRACAGIYRLDGVGAGHRRRAGRVAPGAPAAYPEPVPAPLLIADVPWLLYRSFFALPKSIVGADGQPVNALLGTVNAILTFYDARLSACPPDGVVVCMGAEEAAYRVNLYPPYHAHREPMPPELRAQWLKAPALLESFGWTYATSDRLEADDVMFSHAHAENERGGQALLLTGDRDLYGAVTERVAVAELLKGGKHGEIGPAEVRERYGVEPEQVADFIALRGDPSDGLPGAPGIGAKTAAALLRAHGTLEALLSAAGADASAEDADAAAVRASATMRPRIAAVLRENAALLRTFKQIATLQRVAVELPANRTADFAAGAHAAYGLGMKRLAERLEEMDARAEFIRRAASERADHTLATGATERLADVLGTIHGGGGQARDTGGAFVESLDRQP